MIAAHLDELRAIPEHSLDGIPADLNMIALWGSCRADGPTGQRRMTPVAVRTSPSGTITCWDQDTGEWIPYRTMLLHLTRQADIPGEDEAEADETSEKSPRPGTRTSKSSARSPPSSSSPCSTASAASRCSS